METLNSCQRHKAFCQALTDAERDIEAILAGLRSGEPLERSPALQALAADVVRHRAARHETAIVPWAARLAADVAQATD